MVATMAERAVAVVAIQVHLSVEVPAGPGRYVDTILS